MYKHVAWARKVGQEHKLTPTERSVLVLLCERANKDHQCWPGVKSIAQDTGLSRRTVQRSFDRLWKLGLIDILPRKRTKGGSTSNMYIIQGPVRHPPGVTVTHPPGHGAAPSSMNSTEEEKMKKTPSVSDLLSGGKSGDTTGKTGKSAKDVQAEIPDMSKPIPGEALKWVWTKALAVKDPELYLQGLTQKDMAMLNGIAKKVGGHLLASGLLPIVIENWSKWIAYVATAEGLYGKTVPLLPQIGFVLKHGLHVVPFCQTMTKPENTKPEVQLIAPGSGETFEPPATLEQVESLLGKIDGTGT